MRVRRFTAVLGIAAILAAGGCAAADGEPAGQGAPSATVDDGSPASGAPAASAALPGRSVPPSVVPASLRFSAQTLDGKPFDSATLVGRPAVLWFWAPWCPTCAAEAAHVNALATRTAGRVNVIGVAGLGERPAMREFVSRTKISAFPQLADEQGGVWRHFGITAQATYVLVDAAGTIRHSGPLSEDELTARVDSLVG